MNAVLVRRLIVKDVYLNRVPLALITAGGGLSVALMYAGGITGLLGMLSAFIVLIFLSIILPLQTVVNERKERNLPFVMSLPISPADYTVAKVVANLSAFVILWLAIATGVLGTLGAADFGGLIPLGIVIALAPFVSFCLQLAVALVAESELWSIVTMSVCNVSYSFAWVFLARIPGISEELRSAVPIWNPAVVSIVSTEVFVIVAALGLTFLLQSRKTDFI
jgi:ABC-2 type transport system permease protein